MNDPNEQPTTDDAPMPSLLSDERGATTLEWALLLAAIALPSFYVLNAAIDALTGHYQMMTMINSLPFP